MTADEEQFECWSDDGIRCIRIARPGRRNALTLPMFAALARMLRDADADDSVRAVVLCGAGDAFTAGHDLEAFAEWPQGRGDPVPDFLHALADFTRPLVVAVHGAAVGIGTTLLLHADWICCAPDARLRFPFADLGIGPEAGSSALLPRTVGTVNARRLLLGAETFSGRQAFEWGLVTELVPGGGTLDSAIERARALGNKPAAVLAAIKRLIATPADDVHARIDEEVELINRMLAARAGTH